jgi:hypothetical protein
MNRWKRLIVGLTCCLPPVSSGEIQATPAGAAKPEHQYEGPIKPDVITKAPRSGNGIWGLFFCSLDLAAQFARWNINQENDNAL